MNAPRTTRSQLRTAERDWRAAPRLHLVPKPPRKPPTWLDRIATLGRRIDDSTTFTVVVAVVFLAGVVAIVTGIWRP